MCIIGRRAVCSLTAGSCSHIPECKKDEVPAVKKLLLVALVALGGFFVYRQVQADKAEQDLWTEATDPVPAGR
ncbi:DLW-39 family protein [Kitasatospora cinereorecta]